MHEQFNSFDAKQVTGRFSSNRLNPAGKIKFRKRRSSKVLIQANGIDVDLERLEAKENAARRNAGLEQRLD